MKSMTATEKILNIYYDFNCITKMICTSPRPNKIMQRTKCPLSMQRDLSLIPGSFWLPEFVLGSSLHVPPIVCSSPPKKKKK